MTWIVTKIEGNIVYIMIVIDGRRNLEDIILKKNIKTTMSENYFESIIREYIMKI